MSRSSIVLEQPRRACASRKRPSSRRRLPGRLSFEPLEVRSLLNAATPADALAAFQPNETIDQAWDLGTPSQPATTIGSVGTGPDGAADVTWYHFELQDASRVDLTVSTPAGDRPFASVLSLFNSDPDDWGDPYYMDGYRMLAQVQASPTDGTATYTQDLGPGDYYVAVSGGGNTAFSPVLAGSGYPGAMGIYELTISATDLGLSGDGPTMLSSDPAAGAVLGSSPLAIRVELSSQLDPNTIVPGQTVQLFQDSGGVETPIALASVNFSAAADELQLFPLSPLAPGQYVVQLAGNSSTDPAVLADPNGTPLGEDAQNPAGADESFTFQVDGVDGVAGATASDDTPATARNLGNLVGAGIVEVGGAIGVDPNLGPGLSANQVDLYHFQVTGPGRYAMLAEVFAGRIGSPLDPGVSLFELDPATGSLVFVAGNNNTLDPAQGTDGSYPLYTDSYLSAGLTAGNYYLAVADGRNTPSPIEGQMPGSPGIFDPNQPGTAQYGWTTGAYQLNVMVQPDSGPPEVVASSPSPGQVLDQAPTQITVQFSEPVNVELLAFQAYEVAYLQSLPQVFVEGADGTIDFARFQDYNRLTNTATFLMLDGLPNGSYTLHLSGPGGLTDLGGNPLPGNSPSGDFVIPFSVQGPVRAVSGSMADGFRVISQAGQGVPQDIGVLFPDELQAGVDILRYPELSTEPGADSTQDDYVFQLLQFQLYSFELLGANLPAGAQVTLTDASGQSIPLNSSPDGQSLNAQLDPGTYTVSVSGWSAGESAGLAYQLLIDLYGQQDNAQPLVDGPAPALQVSFDTSPGVPGAPNSGGPVVPGGAGAVGPIAGVTGGPLGGAEPVGSINGGPVSGVSTGGPGSAGPEAVTAVSGSQAEAAVGLAGLGMGPLGGFGGQAGPLASSTVRWR